MRKMICFAVLNVILAVVLTAGCAEPMPIRANYLPVDYVAAHPESERESTGLVVEEHDPVMAIDSESGTERRDTVLYEPVDGFDFVTPPAMLDIEEMSEGFDILSQKKSVKTCPCPADSSLQPVVFEGEGTRTKSNRQAKKPLSGVVNVNTAPVETLVLLPGIGPSLAERIVEYRAKRKFTQTVHLRRVKGIGRAKFEKMKDYITVSGETTLSR